MLGLSISDDKFTPRIEELKLDYPSVRDESSDSLWSGSRDAGPYDFIFSPEDEEDAEYFRSLREAEQVALFFRVYSEEDRAELNDEFVISPIFKDEQLPRLKRFLKEADEYLEHLKFWIRWNMIDADQLEKFQQRIWDQKRHEWKLGVENSKHMR